MARRPRREADLRAWVSVLVRSGLAGPDALRRQVEEAVRNDLRDDDPAATARAWIAEAEADWQRRAATWPEQTDFDRLQRAFGGLRARGVLVLQGCEDHWAARDALAAAGPAAVGIVWFTAPDVWHAVDDGMLEVNLWHASTANAAPGDALLDDVIATFDGAGLRAHFDEGRIEVAASWQRRPGALLAV